MKSTSPSPSIKHWLYEYDTGHRFGPASLESVEAFEKAVSAGKPFFLKGYFGLHHADGGKTGARVGSESTSARAFLKTKLRRAFA